MHLHAVAMHLSWCQIYAKHISGCTSSRQSVLPSGEYISSSHFPEFLHRQTLSSPFFGYGIMQFLQRGKSEETGVPNGANQRKFSNVFSSVRDAGAENAQRYLINFLFLLCEIVILNFTKHNIKI